MVNYWVYPRPRKPRDHSHRPWHVRYDLAYDGGGSRWDGYYRTLWGAKIAMIWNVRVASWGGSAILNRQWADNILRKDRS